MIDYHKVVETNFFTHLLHHSVWFTKDYLLYVENALIKEQYRRYHYKNIRAIYVVPSNGFRNGVIILSLLCILFISFLFLSRFQQYFWYAPLLITLGFQIYHIARGKMGTLYLHTAVSNVRLKAVTRISQANRLIAYFKPFIEDAQKDINQDNSEISREDIVEDIDPTKTIGNDEKIPVSLYYSVLLFILLQALTFFLLCFLSSTILLITQSIFWVSSVTLSIVALFKSRKMHSLKKFKLTNGIYLILNNILLFSYYMIIYTFYAANIRENKNIMYYFLENFHAKAPLITGFHGFWGFLLFIFSIVMYSLNKRYLKE